MAAGVAFGCASVSAAYPSWEPTSLMVPAVRDRTVALADLEASHERWRQRGMESYSYLRALRVAPEEVHLTFVVVRKGVVVERALLKSFTDERGLGDRMAVKLDQTPQLLWRERVGIVSTGRAPI